MDFEGDSRYEKLNNKAKELKKAIKDISGNTYLPRAYFDNGASIGEETSREYKLGLISQIRAFEAGILTNEKEDKIIKLIFEKLYDQKNNLLASFEEPFENIRNNPGRILRFIPGRNINGAQDNYLVLQFIKVLLEKGYIDEANKLLAVVNPFKRCNSKEGVNIYKSEPYLMHRFININKHNFGTAETFDPKTAALYYHVLLKYLLGFKVKGDKLYIKPKVNKGFGNYTFKFIYFDTNYEVSIKFSDNDKIKYDTKYIDEKYILLKNDWKKHKVIINIKEE